jgi:hypothetical protein
MIGQLRVGGLSPEGMSLREGKTAMIFLRI